MVDGESIFINNADEAFQIMIDCIYQGADSIIWHENNITPLFFDLKTKLAGEILQKFSTYRARLAIVGDFDKYQSKSLADFIYESNKGKQINFVSTIEEAIRLFE